jgi:hypothetical protein
MIMRTRVFRGLLLLAVLSICAMPAAAEQKKHRIKAQGSASDTTAARPAPDTACPADDRFARAGFRAFIDPQTGQLREPTPEEAQALSRAARAEFARAVESLEAVVHPDGMVSVDLKGLFMQDLVVVKRPDGSLSMRCLPDSEKELTSPAPPPSRPAPALEER